MDAVPGGTGFLKSLFVPKQEGERSGEGIMTVLRLVLNALESCDCRVLGPTPGQDDTDGAPDEGFAEMAWPRAAAPVCPLIGDQSTFAAAWEGEGWTVVTPDAVQANGIAWMASFLVASKATPSS